MNGKKMQYHRELEKTLASLETDAPAANRPSLLLHACCAPCSSHVIEFLASRFNITLLYYNPNIYPEAEYSRRLSELRQFLPRFPPASQNSVSLAEETYHSEEFFSGIRIKENPELAAEKEKGERCARCYRLRLEHACRFAAEHGFTFFCTTLSISPFKDAQKINEIGAELAASSGGKTQWLYSDFKKKGGFLRSLELSAQFGLYRQQYCGCIFSMNRSSMSHGQQATMEEQP